MQEVLRNEKKFLLGTAEFLQKSGELLRLRIYDPASVFAVLEMKQKQGEQQRKRSLKLRREEAERHGDDRDRQ